MKTATFLILFQTISAIGFPENPRWKEVGTPIPAHVNLDVRWEAPLKLPRKVWIYHLLPNQFSPETISNLMMKCSLTDKDIMAKDANGITFQTSDASKRLSVFFPAGGISYETASHNYGPTNLAREVPEMSQMPKLTTNFLAKIGVNISAIEKKWRA